MGYLKLEENHSPHPRRWWHLPLLLLLIAGVCYIIFERYGSSDLSRGKWQRMEGSIFGTVYHIMYHSDKDLSDSIHSTMDKVDKSLSTFNSESSISQINNNSTTRADSMLLHVIVRSLEISDKTGGCFDITVAPLVNAWGFGFKNSANVDSAMIDSLLDFVGMDKLHIEGSEVKKSDPRLMLDCNAIAKGYGVDAVGRYLESNGVLDYMVEIGGEVRVRGKNPSSDRWRIGINEPVDDSLSLDTGIENVLNLSDISMATSGNYRNYYIKDDKKYAHTIDPHTGYPVQHSILSSTVISSDCMTADAYATAFMVMGLDRAKEILRNDSTLKAYFIYSDIDGNNKTWHSDGLLLDH